MIFQWRARKRYTAVFLCWDRGVNSVARRKWEPLPSCTLGHPAQP